MLHELRVENLLLLERAELRLAPGLNVLTGETGAGKTMLAQAIDLLLGGRARSGIVRPGAEEAYVEGVFSLPAGLDPAIAERLPEDAEELVVARRVWPDGRTRAYLCGRSATLGDLRELAPSLMAFYGQHEHRRLTLSSAQLEVLDAYCGAEQQSLREELRGSHEEVRRLQERTAAITELTGARDRELDLLTFELDEIDAAAPSEDEERELNAERERLRGLDVLRQAAAAGVDAIAPEDGGGVSELLAGPALELEAAAAIDPVIAPAAERLRTIRYELEDLGGELRRYALEIESGATGGPGRLDEVEERLAVFARLKRKHGGTITEVLRHAETCRARKTELEQSGDTLEEMESELAKARVRLDRLAAELGRRRRSAAPKLAAAVRYRLAELAMPDAQFDVTLRPRENGCGPRGADSVEFEIASNPGVPAGPIREIASGGELSRVMLALLSVAHGSGIGQARERGPTAAAAQAPLVFDEIDAGIGGHTARAVGEHLRALAAGRQILCITHLPQVASLAERHFRIEKGTAAGKARTTVSQLGSDGVVAELVRMLGAGEGDRAASQHARRLMKAA